MTYWRNRLPGYLLLALRVVLGVVFVYAAWTKLRESWVLFAFQIDAYQLLPQWAARSLPWAELLLGLLLIVGKWLRVSASLVSLILVSFLAVMARSYLRGMQIDCGCFGSGDVISPYTLLRDSGLLAASLVLTWLAFRAAPTSAETR
jgi:uncharacterized membrane protein YphA (DoxX/SURF4 family)